MRITYSKLCALVPVLAVVLTLVAPATALATGRNRGAFDDVVTVTCVALDGSESTHECTILDDDAIMPLKGGWWLLEDDTVPKDKVIEVTGDVHFVCGSRVDLVSGHVHVACGAHLDLYYKKGCENDAVLSATHGYAVVVNDGVIGERAIPVCVDDGGQVSYIDKDGEPQLIARRAFAAELSAPSVPQPTLSTGMYLVERNCTLSKRLEIQGDVTILVCDGAQLTCEKGIHAPAGSSLTILGQEGQKGRVVADIEDRYGKDIAGIGGDEDQAGGSITICDVAVVASGSGTGAGIGGGKGGDGGTVVIRRSRVTARGGRSAAGIGGGGRDNSYSFAGNGGVVIIEDSEVTAISYAEAAGIGGGMRYSNSGAGTDAGDGGDVTILGNSVVDAKSGDGAAIGRGAKYSENPGKVTLSDNLRVVDLDNGGVIAPFNLRGEYCKYRNHVRVEPGESK